MSLDIFTVGNLISIFVILIYFIVLSGLLFIPIDHFIKNKNETIKFLIPVSMSVQIIFGYIFYCLRITDYYPASYFIGMVLVNLVIIKRYKYPVRDIFKLKIKIPRIILLLGLVTFGLMIYSRFIDSARYVAPGNPDTLAHLVMLKQLMARGYLSNAFYAPGFHLLLLPITKFIRVYDIARFAGAVMGMLTIGGVYLIIRDRLKSATAKLFYFVLIIFPVFNRLGLETIGFFSSALTFIFFMLFIYLATGEQSLKTRQLLTILAITVAGLALTVPLFLLQFVIILAVLLIILRFSKMVDYRKYIAKMVVVILLGIIMAFGHVYLQTKVLTNQGGFPKIKTINLDVDQVVQNDNYSSIKLQSIIDGLQAHPSIINNFLLVVVKTDFFKTMLLPIVNTGKDIFELKNFLPINNVLGFGAYMWDVVSIILLIYAFRKKDKNMMILALSGIIFGISTQSGFLEMSYYRGRSGWYLSFLVVITLAHLFDIMYKEKYYRLAYIGMGLMLCASVYRPLIFPRLVYPEIYAVGNKIVLDHPREQVVIISDVANLFILSDNITSMSLEKQSLVDAKSELGLKFIIIEKKYFNKESVLAGMIFSPRKDIVLADKKISESEEQQFNQAVVGIKKSVEFKKYKLYWANSNIDVYKYSP